MEQYLRIYSDVPIIFRTERAMGYTRGNNYHVASFDLYLDTSLS